jgi:hypothetical protein
MMLRQDMGRAGHGLGLTWAGLAMGFAVHDLGWTWAWDGLGGDGLTMCRAGHSLG